MAGVLFASSLHACVPEAGELDVQVAPPHPGAGGQPGEDVADEGASRGPGEPHAELSGADAAGGSRRLAKRLLAALAVKPRGPRAGYAREQFGHAWPDVDRNGCDTRDDILRRDLADVRVEKGTRDCVVAAGRLADPYTGTDIKFKRGAGSPIDIDHVVALANAWTTGAAAWEPAQRIALANDPLNLLAVDASANRAKGDADAASWLPPDRDYHCAYVARQIAVKAKYGLWVTADERDAMARVLSGCPDQLAPAGDAPTRAPVEATSPRRPDRQTAAREPSRRRDAPTVPGNSRAPDPDYGSCKSAKAHGAGPYRRDVDPEYRYYRDADGDGIVCE